MTTKEQAKDLVKQFLTVKAETIVTPEGKYDSNNGAYEFWEQVQTEIQDI